MDDELKPCPNCGHIPARHDWCSAPDGWSGQYYCAQCSMAGPGVRGDREAMATAWNALPRRADIERVENERNWIAQTLADTLQAISERIVNSGKKLPHPPTAKEILEEAASAAVDNALYGAACQKHG